MHNYSYDQPIRYRVGLVLNAWIKAMLADPKNAAAMLREGNALLEELARVRDESPKELSAKMSELAQLACSAEMGSGRETQGRLDKGSDDGIDWHEVDADHPPFYALDDRLGPILNELVEDLRSAETYIAKNIPAPTRILFIGAPGTGKTSCAFWLGAELEKPVALLRLDAVVSTYVAKSAKNIRACFDAAAGRSAIVFLDELDGIMTRRDTPNPNNEDARKVTSSVIQLLDATPLDQVIIASTNLPSAIDPAVMRRFPTHVTFSPPGRDAREKMLREWWTHFSLDEETMAHALDVSDGKTGDFTKKIAHAAGRSTIRRMAKGGTDAITVNDVTAALGVLAEDGKISGAALAPPPEDQEVPVEGQPRRRRRRGKGR